MGFSTAFTIWGRPRFVHGLVTASQGLSAELLATLTLNFPVQEYQEAPGMVPTCHSFLGKVSTKLPLLQ